VSDAATKQDLENVATQLRSEIADLATRAEFVAMEQRTRAELASAVSQLRGEIAGLATRAELAAMEQRTRAELVAMEQRTHAELAAMEQQMNDNTDQAVSHTANVMMEHIRTLVNVVEEKYEHLPGDVAALRRDFDDHRTDLHLHARPPVTLPKRATKKKPRSS